MTIQRRQVVEMIFMLLLTNDFCISQQSAKWRTRKVKTFITEGDSSAVRCSGATRPLPRDGRRGVEL